MTVQEGPSLAILMDTLLSKGSNDSSDTLVPRANILSPPLPMNEELLRFYSDHNVTLLDNETVHIGRDTHRFNLTGLGEITAGHLVPTTAYKGYDRRVPGIVFAHNPDAYSALSYFPGDLFLFGHTHGGQVNLPFLWERITPLNDTSLKSGLYLRDGRTIFVTRGVGATFPFRLFAPLSLCSLNCFAEAGFAQKPSPPHSSNPSLRPLRSQLTALSLQKRPHSEAEVSDGSGL